jgi:hypothetical protein
MKKERVFAIITVTLAALLLSSVPVLAQAEKSYFTGTWCRIEVNSGTGIVPGESGRSIRKDGWARFNVFTDDPRVTGEFYSYDVTFNLSAPVPVSCPYEKDAREGLVHANFILTPDPQSGIEGTWEGQWKCLYTIEDGCAYTIVTANGHGTGDLDGLKIRIYAKDEFYHLNCSTCDANGWPYPSFNGYILIPASVDGE